MFEAFYVAPLVLIVSCAWALAPVRRDHLRVGVLLALMMAGAVFVAWWGQGSYSAGAAAMVAPAVLLAAFRLLMDGFGMIDARSSRSRGDSP